METQYSDFSNTETEKKNVIIPNVEATDALSYLLGANAGISAGYKVEQFWNIMPTIDGGAFSFGSGGVKAYSG